MQLSEFLTELQKNADEDTQSQLQCIVERIHKEPATEEAQRELSDAEADDEEYDSVGEIEPDEDITAHGILTGEALLQSEFGSHEERVEGMNIDKKESKRREENFLDYQEPKVELRPLNDEEKSIEEVKVESEASHSEDLNSSGRLETPVGLEKKADEERVPTAMQSRPKIPRTPLPEDKLKQAQRENQLLKNNAIHVYVNQQANVKKQKMIQQSARGEERKNFGEDHVSIVTK